MIQVKQVGEGDPLVFDVAVQEDAGATRHRVTMRPGFPATVAGGGHRPEEVVEAAFRFLLDREPKEAILAGFDVADISRYFPDFERGLPAYLAGGPTA